VVANNKGNGGGARMIRIRGLAAIAILVGAANLANAGPIMNLFCPGDCPPSEYSPFRFWAPRAAKAYDDIHGPKIDVDAPDRHPEIPSAMKILQYPCPPVAPAATIIEPPTAPATSKFRY
jgi:hypothetical protein